MGWYINYEISFEDHPFWDDDKVKLALGNIDCHFLYLRNNNEPIAIFSLYMKHDIKELANVLTHFFDTRLKYRVYGTEKWSVHNGKKSY